MKRFVAGAVILLAAYGCGQQGGQVETTVEVPVSVVEIEPATIEEYTETTGTVFAEKSAVLTSEMAGYYSIADNPRTGRPFALGDYVAAGTDIIVLDNPEQEISIRIDSYELSLEIAQQEYEKQQSLFEKGGVTQSELRNAEKALMDARYAYENAQLQMNKFSVTSPIEGFIVSMSTYTPGVWVSSGSDMATIMDYRILLMETNLPSNLLNQVTVGQDLRVTNYTVPDSVLSGTVVEVSPALDAETRTFPARVRIDNPAGTFRPGMFVKAEIITDKRENTIVIPREIILSRRNDRMVYVVEEGFARMRRIELGLENPEEVEVVEGLEMGERLVVDGYETLRDGSRVTVTR